VIECSWKILIDFLNKKEGDLDAMIEAHSSYLDRMVKKVLLLSPKAGREVCFLSLKNYSLTLTTHRNICSFKSGTSFQPYSSFEMLR
jgi:gamma-tubulin complex component 3